MDLVKRLLVATTIGTLTLGTLLAEELGSFNFKGWNLLNYKGVVAPYSLTDYKTTKKSIPKTIVKPTPVPTPRATPSPTYQPKPQLTSTPNTTTTTPTQIQYTKK